MARYHINPYTGVPSVCHAKNGNCPYKAQHYSTFAEAQSASDSAQAERYVEYNREEGLIQKSNWEALKTYDYLNNMPVDDVLKIIETTTDEKMLSDVMLGKTLATASRESRFVKAAMVNPNISDRAKDSIVANPADYSRESLFLFMKNPKFTPKDKIRLGVALPKDEQFQAHIGRLDSVDSATIEDVLLDLQGDNKGHWDTSVAYLARTDKCPQYLKEMYANDNTLHLWSYLGNIY